MFGILCSPKKEKYLTEAFHNLFKPLIKNRDTAIIIFSLPNTNLIEKTVSGSLISRDGITPIKASLPLLIFNFSIQFTRSDVKKLRSLMEVEDLNLINSVNQYNQWAIMEIVYSSDKTKKNLMPYKIFKKDDVLHNIPKMSNFIIKAANGTNLSKIIYNKKTNYGFDLYNKDGKKYYHSIDIQNAILPIVQKGDWIILDTPDLLTYKTKLFVIRAYMQKKASGDWEIILKSMIPQNESLYLKLDKKIDESFLQTINYINCFIPDLGFCFMDFVVSAHGTPYFLNLGGWDNSILSENINRTAQNSLCKNMIEYAKSFFEK